MRQRIVGAIALAGGPKLIIADEPTTNLDVTIQAQYLDLLKELQEQTGVAIIFVTHNLGIVARMCDKLAVMYAGKIVEAGSVRELFNAPQHPYTKALLGSMPKLGSKEKLLAIPGQPPDLATLPPGCAFHPRCPEALPHCAAEEPREVRIAGSWTARCWLAEPLANDSAKEIPACRRRCWKLKASPSTSRSPPRCFRARRWPGSRRWTASISRLPPARPSGSSANPAAARRRPRS